MAINTNDLLQVGVISSMHGVHGEVKVFPTTSDVKRYKKLKEVYLDTKDKMNESDMIKLTLTGVKFFKQFAIVKFEGYDNPNDIEKYKGKPIYVTRENAIKLDKDEYFIADLIGVNVYNESDIEIGTVTDVIETGGVLGGMSDGSTIVFRCAIKPTPSIAKEQRTINKNGEDITVSIKGRHDPIIVPRAVVVVEAMAALTILDAMLENMGTTVQM